MIVPPICIPENIIDSRRDEHDLCVRFFGTYEHGWVGRDFVYLYDEGDAQKSRDAKCDKAIEEAERAFNSPTINVKTLRTVVAPRIAKPLPYSKILKIKLLPPAKFHRRTDYEPDPCKCSPDDEDA